MIYFDGEQDKYNMIFPMPKEEIYEEEFYALKCTYPTDDLVVFYNATKDGTEDISFTKNVMFGEEEYTIKVDSDGIVLGASSDAGYFRAMTSLRQLIRRGDGKTVQFATVHDKPAFEKRAFMLDISRKRKPRVEYILELIDMMAAMKYNEFQLYMEDFCFKYKHFPEYTADFECLTPEDIVKIDKFCQERFVELVPHQNGLGHMSNWLAKPELRHLALGSAEVDPLNIEANSGTLNPLDPKSLELVDKIYDSLLPYFSSNRVHIGLDEATALGMYETEEICKEIGVDGLFVEWLAKLSHLCETKYGKTVMFWSDMLRTHPNAYDKLPKNAVPVAWGYEDVADCLRERELRNLVEHGIEKFYVTPSVQTYDSITGRFESAEHNLRVWGEIGEDYGAYGYLVSHWANPVGISNTVWMYPATAIGAQYAWNTGIKQQGGWRKQHFRRNAMEYCDNYIFGGAKISEHMCEVMNSYLLEPERIHGGQMVTTALLLPLDKTVRRDFFDFTLGNEYNYHEVINRTEHYMKLIEAESFDELYKRELVVGCKMTVVAAEFAIYKIRGEIDKTKAKELLDMLDWVIREHTELWNIRNYENGIEAFLGMLNARRDELAELV